uniref:NADH-ubiquinone oxidoreductase chain 6 n=1 Tax=Calameuta idolon TaxID=1001283 RepID=A0A0S1S5R5_9HYME|nr:NADH dehydrogenase subunit 6 [Calameuta idolon]ALM04151.1 NADH dehydrogenase subunit 6 [Calameuta idolon]
MSTEWFNSYLTMEFMIKYTLIYSSIMMVSLVMLTKDNHPIELMIYLTVFSIIMCIKTSFLNKNFWFSYLLFLTMIGGIMILFLYFVSTASNEMSELTKPSLLMSSMILIAIFISLISMLMTWDMFSTELIEVNMNINPMFLNTNWSETISYQMNQMFNNNYKISLMIMIYLLFTLFTVMKMCMKMYGPLRQYQ